MTQENFTAAMISLQKYFGKSIEDAVIKLYWEQLQKYTDEVFAHALMNIFTNFHPSATVPFPLISDFMEAIGDTAENRAQLAVMAIKRAAESIGSYRSVDFGDPALHATINRFGGWPEIANWANHGKWEFQEKNFMHAYIAAYECGEEDPPVMGNFEMDNMQKNEMAFTEFQTKKYIEGKTAVRMEWRGADFSHQIKNNRQEQKMIPEIKTMIDGIGKSID
jgi:hypothetical protein